MYVRDAMTARVVLARPADTVRQVARWMKEADIGFLPVVDGDALVGCITDRDIVVRCVAEGHDDLLCEPIGRVMSRDVETVEPDDDLVAAAQQMGVEQIRRLVVVERGCVVGVLSHGDVVQATRGRGPAQEVTVGVTERSPTLEPD